MSSRLHRRERGITGLETAIILIAFVVVASVFSYVVLSAGFLATDEAKGTIVEGLDKTSASLEIRGSIIAERATVEVTDGTTMPVNGDAAETVFELDPLSTGAAPVADFTVVTGSETVYVGGTAQTRNTDYTINNSTGVITFAAGSVPGAVAITADYSYYGLATVANGGQGAEVVGVGTAAVGETSFTLGHYPIVAGSETIYIDGVAQTDPANYSIVDATGVITLVADLGTNEVLTAVYQYTGVTKVDYVKFVVACAISGSSIDMTPPSTAGTGTTNRTVMSYHDNDERDDKVTNWSVSNLGYTNDDNVLETNEKMEVTVDLNSDDIILGTNTEFNMEIRTPQGGVLVIERTTPAALLTVMDLS